MMLANRASARSADGPWEPSARTLWIPSDPELGPLAPLLGAPGCMVIPGSWETVRLTGPGVPESSALVALAGNFVAAKAANPEAPWYTWLVVTAADVPLVPPKA